MEQQQTLPLAERLYNFSEAPYFFDCLRFKKMVAAAPQVQSKAKKLFARLKSFLQKAGHR